MTRKSENCGAHMQYIQLPLASTLEPSFTVLCRYYKSFGVSLYERLFTEIYDFYAMENILTSIKLHRVSAHSSLHLKCKLTRLLENSLK